MAIGFWEFIIFFSSILYIISAYFSFQYTAWEQAISDYHFYFENTKPPSQALRGSGVAIQLVEQYLPSILEFCAVWFRIWNI
jgi:hypothetical protein